jgi:CheY-like chemotaxis protein
MIGDVLQILLAEDDDDHAEIVARGLAQSRVPITIHRVADGEAALNYVFRRGGYADPALSVRPDAILLDLRMPKVDGIEVLHTIKQDPTLRDIPVVVLTTSEAERDIDAAYRNHANGYLVKPNDFLDVVKMMDAFSTYWLAWNRPPSKGPPVGKADTGQERAR